MADLPASLITALQNGKVIPFVGAGVSLAVKDAQGNALFPSWKQLLQNAAARLRAEGNADMADVVDALVKVGQYLNAALNARDGLGPLWHARSDRVRLSHRRPSHFVPGWWRPGKQWI